MTAEPRSKQTARSERTRTALLREATRRFARLGYEATFVDDVALGAKLTKGAFYHQFRDKRDLFEAVVETRISDLIKTVKRQSGEQMDRLGVPRKAVPRYAAGLEILIDGLCKPANRRILLIDGAAVLGHERWSELWGARMLDLVRSVFRDAFKRGDIKPELVEPLSHMLYGALQEMALAIGHASDPDAARERFGAAAQWVLESVLRAEREEKP